MEARYHVPRTARQKYQQNFAGIFDLPQSNLA
jgi:hypothetical protein